MGIMLVRKLNERTGVDSDGATGAHRLIGGSTSGSIGVDPGSIKEKFNRSGGQGGLPPHAASPSGGKRGVTLAISKPAQKTKRGFL